MRSVPVSLTCAAAALFSLCSLAAQTHGHDQQPIPGDDLHAVGDAVPDPRTIDAQPIDVQTIFRLANEDRATQGLSSLSWSPELATAARAHARMMAANRELSHQYAREADLTNRTSQAGAHFSSIAENIARGGSARQIDREWMQSPPHRANLLDPRMNALGVAVVASGGTLYAVEDFAASVPLLTPSAVERTVAAELQRLQINSASGSSGALFIDASHNGDVRGICSEENASGVGKVPYWTAPFEVTWQGADLSLPPSLIAAVRRGQYHAASIGACPATGGAFTVYRVTVVLD